MQEYVLPDTPTPWWVKRKWPLPGRGTSRCSTGFWEAANSAAVTPASAYAPRRVRVAQRSW